MHRVLRTLPQDALTSSLLPRFLRGPTHKLTFTSISQRTHSQAHFHFCHDLSVRTKIHHISIKQGITLIPFQLNRIIIFCCFLWQNFLRSRQFGFFFEVKIKLIHLAKQKNSMYKEVAKTQHCVSIPYHSDNNFSIFERMQIYSVISTLIVLQDFVT
jgi:hypothetical protein